MFEAWGTNSAEVVFYARLCSRPPDSMGDRPPTSLLDAFCIQHDIATGELAMVSDVSRQYALRIRKARHDVRLGSAKKFARGVSIIVGRKVSVAELFDLDYEFDPSAPLTRAIERKVVERRRGTR